MSDESIYVVEHESYVELYGINGETEIDERIVASITANPRIMKYVVQQIAHNRAEQRLTHDQNNVSCTQRIGDILASELIEVAEVLHEKMPSAEA